MTKKWFDYCDAVYSSGIWPSNLLGSVVISFLKFLLKVHKQSKKTAVIKSVFIFHFYRTNIFYELYPMNIYIV